MADEPLTRGASLTGYVDLARTLGLDPYRLAAAEGLPGACLADPDLLVPAAAVGRLLERSAERSGAFDFGLRLAETRNVSNLGAVGLVAREQPNLRKALETLIRYMWSHNQALSLRLEDHGEFAILRERMAGGRPGRGRQAYELTLGVIVRTIRRLIGPTWRPEAVALAYPRPPDLVPYRRVLGVEPMFDQDFSGLVIAARDFDAPVAGADAVAARRLERSFDLASGPAEAPAAGVVRDLIVALLPSGGANIERVAAHLGASRRTLHRRLAAEGTSFTALLDEARVSLARALIAGGRRSLTEIAEQLGYGSLSAFSRWRRHRLRPGVRDAPPGRTAPPPQGRARPRSSAPS